MHVSACAGFTYAFLAIKHPLQLAGGPAVFLVEITDSVEECTPGMAALQHDLLLGVRLSWL